MASAAGTDKDTYSENKAFLYQITRWLVILPDLFQLLPYRPYCVDCVLFLFPNVYCASLAKMLILCNSINHENSEGKNEFMYVLLLFSVL